MTATNVPAEFFQKWTDLQAEHNALLKEKIEILESKNDLERWLLRTTHSCEKLQTENDELSKKYDALSDKHETLNNHYDELKEEHEECRKETIAMMNHKEKDYTNMVNNMQAEIQKWKATVDTMKTEMTRLYQVQAAYNEKVRAAYNAQVRAETEAKREAEARRAAEAREAESQRVAQQELQKQRQEKPRRKPLTPKQKAEKQQIIRCFYRQNKCILFDLIGVLDYCISEKISDEALRAAVSMDQRTSFSFHSGLGRTLYEKRRKDFFCRVLPALPNLETIDISFSWVVYLYISFSRYGLLEGAFEQFCAKPFHKALYVRQEEVDVLLSVGSSAEEFFTCVAGLAKHIQIIHINETNMDSIAWCEWFDQLQTIDLSGCHCVDDFSPLCKVPRLREVWYDNNTNHSFYHVTDALKKRGVGLVWKRR
ncbi:hypothetical protein AGDE_14614 [Angomonas deanei]|uniref:Uncharacterized protein n=1 Tax=Angomonas deanei TaxID=59799 RepID=A0A7G2CRI1_9TRYP|nr:hypothetical protein AGDE_14614 [Angomonas deanei]CAD2222428.1 hypothetical protein, conserved [Angomonas deanei]|eukprot:EPY20542.1 hypothetical protein AGDE_14614 [Angomonas deanei]